jgi:hypothetical protein
MNRTMLTRPVFHYDISPKGMRKKICGAAQYDIKLD